MEKLMVALTNLAIAATEYLDRTNNPGRTYQPTLPVCGAEVGPIVAEPTPAPVPAVAKKEKKAKVVKAPVVEAVEAVEAEVVITPEMETKAYEDMMAKTKEFIIIAKNDTPEDGKTRALRWMKEEYKVAKLGDLSYAQKIAWVQRLNAEITGRK